MDKNLTIYLHFASNVEEKTWESNFCLFFNIVMQQVNGAAPTLISNIDIPGSSLLNKDDLYGSLQADFLIIVLNPIEKKISDEEINGIIPVLKKFAIEQHNHIFITQRFNKKDLNIPQELQKYPLFNFFDLNPKTLEIIDFNQDLNEDFESQYIFKLTDLAYSIKECLNFKENDSANSVRNNSIYLAEVSADQLRHHDRLNRSLMLSGYNVLPKNSLIYSENYENDVKSIMEKCILSIHILGELYGDTFLSSDYSFQELQNRYFQDVCQKQNKNKDYDIVIKRIIWLPPQLEPFEDKQIQYLKRINREINNSENTELIQSTLSDLKIIIDQKIKYLLQPTSSSTIDKSNDILVITDIEDVDSIGTIKETFSRNYINYQFLNIFEHSHLYKQSELMNRINKFRTYLVMNTKSDSDWITSIINLLARSKGYEGSELKGHVGLFSLSSRTGFNNSTNLTIDPILYNDKNLVEQLEQFISKVRT